MPSRSCSPSSVPRPPPARSVWTVREARSANASSRAPSTPRSSLPSRCLPPAAIYARASTPECSCGAATRRRRGTGSLRGDRPPAHRSSGVMPDWEATAARTGLSRWLPAVSANAREHLVSLVSPLALRALDTFADGLADPLAGFELLVALRCNDDCRGASVLGDHDGSARLLDPAHVGRRMRLELADGHERP